MAQFVAYLASDLVVAGYDTPLGQTFFPVIFSPCEKSSQRLWKESCVSTVMRKPGNAKSSSQTSVI